MIVKDVRIVKNCQIGQVMFPHYSDQISQKSKVSGLLFVCQK